MMKRPIRLANDPIIEAVAELRFEPTVPAAGDLIPGMIFPEFKDILPKIERLPLSDFPRQFQEADINLRYGATQRLSSEKFALLLGSRVATIACGKPYVGWEKFRELIDKVLQSLNKTGMVKQVERFSVKYVNILEAKDRDAQYGLLNLKSTLAQFDLTKHASIFRTEIIVNNLINIIEISPDINVEIPEGKKARGLMLAIDTIHNVGNEFWKDSSKIIDNVHDTEKAFFYDILKPEAIESFGPVWE
jgi:uncharacterized protein (TIGR04255 family)